MAQVLRHLAPNQHPDLLVGPEGSDDAAVYRISDDQALIFTADFFAPIVDDAATFGEIAATNAINDVFVMGGKPLLCLNLVGWPRDELPLDLLGEVIRGGQEAATAAGALVVGGHSVDDPEPKYGMAVVGMVRPGEILANSTARPGDELILTKPLGTGLIVTALKRDAASQGWVDAAVASMRRSLGPAMAATRGLVSAATDVTGFGLVGHAGEMARASGTTIVLRRDAIPFLPGALELAEEGVVAGGSKRNLEAADRSTKWGPTDLPTRLVLADAQTAGGALLAVGRELADQVLTELERAGDGGAVRVGTVQPHDPDADVIID